MIATCQVPFIQGGAELMADELRKALVRAGHQAEIVTLPFRFTPLSSVVATMRQWQDQDWVSWDSGSVDVVIAIRFPAFHLRHPHKLVWLTHQHRPVYDLWNTPYGLSGDEQGCNAFRDEIIEADTQALKVASKIYTISENVSQRLLRFNQVSSKVIYHPPPLAEAFSPGDLGPFIFCPGRLESLKRQDLLIRAMLHVPEPVIACIVGEGSQLVKLWALVENLGLKNRVRFYGHVDHETLRQLYSNCLAVFFGPHDEDYGYITLEAMLSAKPVVTCQDSGGPLEFVQHDQTGYVVAPDPEAIAGAFTQLVNDLPRARRMGEDALAHYHSLGISWDHVVQTLIGL
jgi:glycosyltransferase involved in cell wall biosynthesis